MKALEATVFRFARRTVPAPISFALCQEVPGRLYYECECSGYRSAEFDIWADVTDELKAEMRSHVDEAHETKEAGR